jgi:hypothetical protein
LNSLADWTSKSLNVTQSLINAVSCEPVSAPNSLQTGKLTGNFAESDP